MRVEFNCITNITKTDPKTNKTKVIKKDVIYLKSFNPADIEYETFADANGKVVKSRTTLRVGEDYFVVKHPIEYVRAALRPLQVTGLISKMKNYGNRNPKKV